MKPKQHIYRYFCGLGTAAAIWATVAISDAVPDDIYHAMPYVGRLGVWALVMICGAVLIGSALFGALPRDPEP